MEASKDMARSRFRQQQRNDRAHRRGRGRGTGGGGGATRQQHPELDSNVDRYEASSDELDGPDAGPRPRSNGADLSRLLADTEPLFSQAHYRHRALLQPGGGPEDAPVVDVAAAAEGLLSLDLPALDSSLRALPLATLLGIPAAYCLPGSGVPGVDDTDFWEQRQLVKGQQQEQQSAGPATSPAKPATAPLVQPPVAPTALPVVAQLPPTLVAGAQARSASTLTAPAPAAAAPAVLPPVLQAASSGSGAQRLLVPPVATATPSTALAQQRPKQQPVAGDEADLDALLGMLGCAEPSSSSTAATGHKTSPPVTAAPVLKAAAAVAASIQPIAGAAGPAAAAAATRPTAVLAGVTTPVVAPAAAVPRPAAAPAASRPATQRTAAAQSVEDWLDSL